MPPRTRRQAQQTIYSVSGLAPGTHTIQIVKTSGTYALLNGFDVTRTINDTDPVIAYNGSWYYNAPSRGLGDYQDDVHATANADTVTVSFYAPRSPSAGAYYAPAAAVLSAFESVRLC